MGGDVAPADIVAVSILALAAARGLWLGLIREVFSVASLVAACLAVRFFVQPAGVRLEELAGGSLSPLAAKILAGTAIVIGVVGLFAVAARLLRRGVRFAGLGWADRAGGGVVGAAEGTLVVALLLALAVSIAGRSHPLWADSQALATLDRLEEMARGEAGDLPDVAAPGRNL